MGGESEIRCGADLQVADYQTAQKRQLSMKEVRTSRNHGHWKCLGSRPVHHINQRNRVIVLAVQHQRARMQGVRHRSHIKTRGGSAHQNQLLGRTLCAQRLNCVADYKRAEREPCQRQRSLCCGTTLGCVVDNRHQILQLASPRIVGSFSGPNAAKIEPHSAPPALNESTGQRLNHFVVHGSGEQGVRVRNDGHATWHCAWRQTWHVFQRFNRAHRASQHQSTGLLVHGNAIKSVAAHAYSTVPWIVFVI